ncbi:DNA-3-methyladenine glycosylase [Halorussus sp. MSC15.2]|uniref:DNA-3-methyladenine glycosylase family protein n=1 Tax=Halorussus sp. MSC15.2 TaxID=2283638 RepID=UPI0013D7F3AC|nr:DNA-3-methyladenine glycosylase [Halorussus sp. MSC15.2]NEU56382.1 DNA-3-methyladenine glycosylase 2 family protein [Halorussus sp. MSC15.2]
MNSGSIAIGEFEGGLDVQTTLESGQTFLWRRDDGRAYETGGASGGSAWYHTVVGGHTDGESEVLRVRQRDDRLEWEASFDAESLVAERLRLDDDLPAIFERIPDHPLLADARETYPGLRIVNDPFFPCLVSFICSAQMRVGRIHGMQTALAREFGETVEFDGETYHAFPTPERLARATEDELRELGLGYRAPYVRRSAELVASGEATADDVRGLDYEDARDAMQAFVGVGDKVADCVLLFSLGYLEAVPLDTWIQTAIAEHYPHCEKGSYAETSRALREEFGGEFAGYAQTYVFHYLRTRG